jgi:hypothetical protein
MDGSGAGGSRACIESLGSGWPFLASTSRSPGEL